MSNWLTLNAEFDGRTFTYSYVKDESSIDEIKEDFSNEVSNSQGYCDPVVTVDMLDIKIVERTPKQFCAWSLSTY